MSWVGSERHVRWEVGGEDKTSLFRGRDKGSREDQGFQLKPTDYFGVVVGFPGENAKQ